MGSPGQAAAFTASRFGHCSTADLLLGGNRARHNSRARSRFAARVSLSPLGTLHGPVCELDVGSLQYYYMHSISTGLPFSSSS
jgi:hypothetical protein